MTGPDRLWLNLNHANQQRPAASFVTKGPLAGPPYTQYVRADLAQAMVAAAYEDAAGRVHIHMLGRSKELFGRMVTSVRAGTPDDAKAALERVKREARNEALREAADVARDRHIAWHKQGEDCAGIHLLTFGRVARANNLRRRCDG